MKDKIELNWTLNISYTFQKYDIFEALVNLCTTYFGDIPEEYDYSEFIINWLEENLADYKEEFLSMLDMLLDINCNVDGEIDNDNITDLLDDEEFMTEFRDYLND